MQEPIEIPPTPQPSSKRKWLLLGLTVFLIVVGIGVFFYWLIILQFEETTDDAYVQGNLVQVMPQVQGIVTAINADDTDLVKENQPLVLLDNTDSRLALIKASNDLANTIRQVRQLYENADQSKANVAVNQTQYLKAQQDYWRRKNLDSSAISREDLEHSRLGMVSAQAALNLAQHQYSAAAALVENTDLLHYPSVLQAEANVRQAFINDQRTTIRSPVTGFVAKRSVQLGQEVAPGNPLMAVIPLNEIWVEANFKEVQLGNMRIGQPVKFTADIYGDKVMFRGKVLGIGAGTGSVFSVLPLQNATGNWIKIVQRLPVRISIDNPEILAKHPLRLGLSVNVTVDTHDRSGAMLTTVPATTTIYETNIYQLEQQGANNLINRIIQQNAGPAINLPTPAKLMSPKEITNG